MAGKGQAPKPTDQKLGRPNGKPDEPTRITFEPVTGPDLPETVDWHPQTRLWWDSLRFSPLAELLMDADWQFLIDTAMVHHQFWTTGHSNYASELRLRVAKIGVTPEERRRLRVEATEASPEPEQEQDTSAAAQRRRNMRIAG